MIVLGREGEDQSNRPLKSPPPLPLPTTPPPRYEHFLLPYAAVTVATFVFLLLHILKNEDSRMKVRGLVGFSSMAVGAALWVVELHTCRDYLKLHACWHLGVGAATYYVVRATHFA